VGRNGDEGRQVDAAPLNDAIVDVTLQDADGANVRGQAWPPPMRATPRG